MSLAPSPRDAPFLMDYAEVAERALQTAHPRAARVERVTRHPFFVGVALLASAHLLLATRLVGTVFFAGLAALAILGAWHQDRKLSPAGARRMQAISPSPRRSPSRHRRRGSASPGARSPGGLVLGSRRGPRWRARARFDLAPTAGPG